MADEISREPHFYKWRAKFGGIDALLMARMKELEDENRWLTRCMPKSDSRPRSSPRRYKKLVASSQRREMTQRAVTQHALRICVACTAFGISETCYCYRANLPFENEKIVDWRIRLANIQRNGGLVLFISAHQARKASGARQPRCHWPCSRKVMRYRPWSSCAINHPIAVVFASSISLTVSTRKDCASIWISRGRQNRIRSLEKVICSKRLCRTLQP
jgi:hypothetical protein